VPSTVNIWPKNFCPDLPAGPPASQDPNCVGATASIIAAGSSPASTFTVDGTPPAAPTVTMPSHINSSNVTQVPISGTAEVGSTITGTIKSSGGGPTFLLNGGQPIAVAS